MIGSRVSQVPTQFVSLNYCLTSEPAAFWLHRFLSSDTTGYYLLAFNPFGDSFGSNHALKMQ